jgi:hypothetical protein
MSFVIFLQSNIFPQLRQLATLRSKPAVRASSCCLPLPVFFLLDGTLGVLLLPCPRAPAAAEAAASPPSDNCLGPFNRPPLRPKEINQHSCVGGSAVREVEQLKLCQNLITQGTMSNAALLTAHHQHHHPTAMLPWQQGHVVLV